MEIAAFLIAFLLVVVAVLIGWGRIPIVWRRPRTKSRDAGIDPGTDEP